MYVLAAMILAEKERESFLSIRNCSGFDSHKGGKALVSSLCLGLFITLRVWQ